MGAVESRSYFQCSAGAVSVFNDAPAASTSTSPVPQSPTATVVSLPGSRGCRSSVFGTRAHSWAGTRCALPPPDDPGAQKFGQSLHGYVCNPRLFLDCF